MHPLFPFVALELAREHQEAARRGARAPRLAATDPRPSTWRHALAIAFAGISRSSARAARRLDDCLADDLVRGVVARDGA
jgi:hypothetical protein